MIKNIDIYFSRLTSAICLFLILAEANVWLTPLNNTILVMGYRLFILLTPVLFFCFKQHLTFIAFAFVELGILCWFSNYLIFGTLFFSMGIAMSGYMLKYYSSFSVQGSAGNKIALNIGSIISGILVMMNCHFQLLMIFSFFIILASFFSFLTYHRRTNSFQPPLTASHFNYRILFTRTGLAWALIGFVIGVKLISLVSILPQLLMSTHHGHLPSWFGGLLILNSIIVVIFQMPVMKKIKKLDKLSALFPLMAGMFIIILSPLLNLSNCFYAIAWTFTLSIIECTISYLDKLSQDDNALLIKEAAVGIGSAATVFCVRFFDPLHGSVIIGLVALLLLFISISIFKKQESLTYQLMRL